VHIKENGSQVTKTNAPPIEQEPLIPIGTEGILRELPYKMIGYMEKKEVGTHYYWREYMLYNYSKGYAFLAEYLGHWSYIAGEAHFPDLKTVKESRQAAAVDFRENDFALYNRYEPSITGLAGEFDWDVLDERVITREYIMPPYLLVNEKNLRDKTQNDWYLGEYIEPKEIAEAFNLNVSDFPHKVGVGANQRSRWLHQWQNSSRMVPMFILIVLILGFLRSVQHPAKVILSQDYSLNLSDKAKMDSVADSVVRSVSAEYEFQPFKTRSFKIDSYTPLEFHIRSEVDNNWTEATILLVNDQSNETWEVTKSIEYYHGYEDGESWSEGSTNEDVLLSHIPPGSYHLNIYPYSGDRSTRSLGLDVITHPQLWRNVIMTILALSLYPAFCWIMTYSFERRRWMNSDYSPYQKEQSTDDDDE
jgi:hypothetical protein